MNLKTSLITLIVVVACGVAGAYLYFRGPISENPPAPPRNDSLSYRPRKSLDTGGFMLALYSLKPLQDPTDLEEMRTAFNKLGHRNIESLDKDLAGDLAGEKRIRLLLVKAVMFLYEGDAINAYEVMQEARALAQAGDTLAEEWLYP
jgi:hypothetical protein